MRTLLLIALFALQTWVSAQVTPFPERPNENLTPGAVCDRADTFRYPEHIPYCNRNVSGGEKDRVIRQYDQHLGYEIQRMNRNDFKIDHYIPLCMGGGNTMENLWPQHKSIFNETDPLEPKLCELMAQGRMLQSRAIEIIRQAKKNPNEARKILRDLGN